MQTASPTYPKAIKEHRCNWCSQTIQIGEVYEKQTVFEDGSAYTWKNHKRCDELTSKLKMFQDKNGEGLSEDEFCDNVIEYYMELVNFDRKKELPPFKEMLHFVFRKFSLL